MTALGTRHARLSAPCRNSVEDDERAALWGDFRHSLPARADGYWHLPVLFRPAPRFALILMPVTHRMNITTAA